MSEYNRRSEDFARPGLHPAYRGPATAGMELTKWIDADRPTLAERPHCEHVEAVAQALADTAHAAYRANPAEVEEPDAFAGAKEAYLAQARLLMSDANVFLAFLHGDLQAATLAVVAASKNAITAGGRG